VRGSVVRVLLVVNRANNAVAVEAIRVAILIYPPTWRLE
jgi:hypothetical protein